MIDELGFDELGRPCKELYIMDLCFHVRKRSIDKSSKCGCVVVDDSGSILSTGYNNPVRGFPDHKAPQERPLKYSVFEHAERNAIYNAARKGIPLEGSTFYVTGLPCAANCLRGIIQVGAKEIVYGPYSAKMTDDNIKGEIDDYLLKMEGQSLKLTKFQYMDGLLKMNPELADELHGRLDITIFPERQIVPWDKNKLMFSLLKHMNE